MLTNRGQKTCAHIFRTNLLRAKKTFSVAQQRQPDEQSTIIIQYLRQKARIQKTQSNEHRTILGVKYWC